MKYAFPALQMDTQTEWLEITMLSLRSTECWLDTCTNAPGRLACPQRPQKSVVVAVQPVENLRARRFVHCRGLRHSTPSLTR
jgi:hypothetical protein